MAPVLSPSGPPIDGVPARLGPSRTVNLTESRSLLRKHAAHFVDDLDKHDLKWAMYRLEHMLALMQTLLPHE